MRGGVRETEVTALAVRPNGRPFSSRVVITVTPVAKWPMTRRSSLLSIATTWLYPGHIPSSICDGGQSVAVRRATRTQCLGNRESDRQRAEREQAGDAEGGLEPEARRQRAERDRPEQQAQVSRHAVDADHGTEQIG